MAANKASVLVWDWTVRVVHWSLVIGVGLMWWTAEEKIFDWHLRIGLTLLGLLSFRIVWGFIGPPSARFPAMIASLSGLPAYVRALLGRRHVASAGHNPAGVLSVFALIGLLCLQVGTGLFSVDRDGFFTTPFSHFLSYDQSREVAEFHETAFNVLLAFIGLHIVAIAAYRFLLRDRLVGPMITGRRPASDFEGEAPAANRAGWLRVGIAAAIAFGVLTLVWTL